MHRTSEKLGLVRAKKSTIVRLKDALILIRFFEENTMRELPHVWE
jgi:hypothetical protein